jgi:hypothetical protein
MFKLRVESFTISLDGFGAGPDQDINNPLGVRGSSLHRWALSTRTFQKNVFGSDGGGEGIDDDFAARGFQNIWAWISAGTCSDRFADLGQMRAGVVGGGENPLSRPGARADQLRACTAGHGGGTTFHFVTKGIAAALAQAREAAEGKDVRLGGA